MTQVIAQPAPGVIQDASVLGHSYAAVRYVFTGGGTGGHVYPALAIADEIRARTPDARIVYIGARGKIEATLVPQRGYPLHLVHARGMPSTLNPLPVLGFVLHTGLGLLESLILLLWIRPQMVVATGGYASSPVLLALAVLRFLRLSSARCFVHEQNVVPGKVNRLANWIADRIGVSFRASLPFFAPEKGVWVGYPVRREIGTVSREEARVRLDIPSGARVVFAFGGSQGARSINRAMVDALPALLARPDVHVLHVIGQTRSADYDAAADTRMRLERLGLSPEARARYRQVVYAHDIHLLYAASDLVIGRAGAATVTEICACGRPAVLIPLPYAPGDHQAMNARTLEAAGAAFVVYEEIVIEEGGMIGAVSGPRLASRIFAILDDPERQAGMAVRARETFDRQGLDRIVEELARLHAGIGPTPATRRREDNGRPQGPEQEILPPLSPFQLVGRFRGGRDEAFIQGIGEDYLKYRIDGYLKSSAWPVRNEGVKLVGLLGYRDRLPFLLALLTDKTPAPWFQRLLGGDYRQVGFIRRNAVIAIMQLGVYDPSVRAVLLALMADPYYEVRSATARALSALSGQVGQDPEIVAGLRRLMRDPAFEVAVEAAKTLGRLDDASLIAYLRTFYLHSNWRMREAVLHALIELVRRGVVRDPAVLREEIDRMLITCVHFEPTFPIKRTLNELATLVEQRAVEAAPDDP